MEFEIAYTWDGQPVDHEPMRVELAPSSKPDHFEMRVSGPLFRDPDPPSSPPGSTDMLWNYEVVEAFFLNSADETYLEVELGPYGHYLLLMLQGKRNAIKTMLEIDYSAKIKGNKWLGLAVIPISYLPPNVDYFNAFAIHGSEPNIKYEELYPQQPPLTQPDFHRLQDFQPIDLSSIVSDNAERDYSDVWTEVMTPI